MTELSDRPERISWAAYWELLMNLTRREVKGRYTQSLFGIGWAIAQPLATMAVFTLVFSRLAAIPSGGAPYPLFAYAALVPWFFFSNSVNSGTLSLITYRNIVTKTYFPREIVPLAQVGSRLVDLTASAGLFALLMVYYGVAPGPWALLLPLFIVMLVAFAVGITLVTSSVNVFYRDVNPVVQIGLQLWLYLTPVAYPLSAVNERYHPFFMLNPLTAIVEGMRSILLFGRAPDWTLVATSGALIITLLVVASVMFKRMDKYFADVI
ncbi:MAG: ABC transporter permease [Acidobacteriota bacterium]|nr:ABC transporter permease [Acidobacteriota bacterium]MDP2389201.1 ABC transporter permease [Acidobacteriota bacterium]